MNIVVDKFDLALIIITSILYTLFLIGLGILFLDFLKNYYLKIKMRNRLRARRKTFKKETWIEQHLRRVLSVSMKKPIEPKRFICLNAIMYFLLTFVGMQNVPMLSAICIASLITSMPYLLLRVRLETVRRKGSFEGEKLISEFLSQYRICNFNIYKTIEQVILVSEGTKISGKLLFKLLLKIRNTGNTSIIWEATNSFAYGVNTNWSKMLANNIRIAAESGTNISLALEDILIQLREARVMVEERKRLNSEAARMAVFLVPFMYLGTVIMSIKYLGITPSKFIHNQIYTEQGFLLLLLAVFLFLVNLALIEIVNNQRFDY